MITGIVSKVITKPWNGKVFHSLALVNDEIYGFGVYSPGANIGDKVSFEATKNVRGFWEADKNTLRIDRALPENVSNGLSGVSMAHPQASQTTITRKDPAERGFWEKKEVREITNDHLRSLGAARNTAIEWVKFLIEKEAVPMPTKVSAREESLNLLLDDYTAKFMAAIDPVRRPEEVKKEASTPGEVKKVGRPSKGTQTETSPVETAPTDAAHVAEWE